MDTLLTDAAREGDVREAKRLLRDGANVNGDMCICAATPLTLAVAAGQPKTAWLLQERGGNLNCPVFFQRDYALHAILFLRKPLGDPTVVVRGTDLFGDYTLGDLDASMPPGVVCDLKWGSYVMRPPTYDMLHHFDLIAVDS